MTFPPTPRWGTRFGRSEITPETLLIALEHEVLRGSPRVLVEVMAELAHAGYAWAAVSHLTTFIAPLFIGIAEPLWPQRVCKMLDDIEVALRMSGGTYNSIVDDVDSMRAYLNLGVMLSVARKSPLVGSAMEYYVAHFAQFTKLVNGRFFVPRESDISTPKTACQNDALRAATFRHIMSKWPVTATEWKALADNAVDEVAAKTILKLNQIALRTRLSEMSKNTVSLFFNAILLRFRGVPAEDVLCGDGCIQIRFSEEEISELVSNKHRPLVEVPRYWFNKMEATAPSEYVANERNDEYVEDLFSRRVAEVYNRSQKSPSSLFFGQGKKSFNILVKRARETMSRHIPGRKRLRRLASSTA
jgi:hypothetical protein